MFAFFTVQLAKLAQTTREQVENQIRAHKECDKQRAIELEQLLQKHADMMESLKEIISPASERPEPVYHHVNGLPPLEHSPDDIDRIRKANAHDDEIRAREIEQAKKLVAPEIRTGFCGGGIHMPDPMQSQLPETIHVSSAGSMPFPEPIIDRPEREQPMNMPVHYSLLDQRLLKSRIKPKAQVLLGIPEA